MNEWGVCEKRMGTLLSKLGEGRGGGKLRCVVRGGREGTLSVCFPSSFEGSYLMESRERGIHRHYYHHHGV